MAEMPPRAGLGREAIGVMVFPGDGINDNLADKAHKLGIPLFDFRKRSA